MLGVWSLECRSSNRDDFVFPKGWGVRGEGEGPPATHPHPQPHTHTNTHTISLTFSQREITNTRFLCRVGERRRRPRRLRLTAHLLNASLALLPILSCIIAMNSSKSICPSPFASTSEIMSLRTSSPMIFFILVLSDSPVSI